MGKAKKQAPDAAAPVVDADDAVFQQRALELKGANHNSPAVFPFIFRLVPRWTSFLSIGEALSRSWRLARGKTRRRAPRFDVGPCSGGGGGSR